MKDDREIYCLEKEEQIMFDQMKTLLYKAGSSYDKLKVGFLAKGYRGVVATKAIRVNMARCRKNNQLFTSPNHK